MTARLRGTDTRRSSRTLTCCGATARCRTGYPSRSFPFPPFPFPSSVGGMMSLEFDIRKESGLACRRDVSPEVHSENTKNPSKSIISPPPPPIPASTRQFSRRGVSAHSVIPQAFHSATGLAPGAGAGRCRPVRSLSRGSPRGCGTAFGRAGLPLSSAWGAWRMVSIGRSARLTRTRIRKCTGKDGWTVEPRRLAVGAAARRARAPSARP